VSTRSPYSFVMPTENDQAGADLYPSPDGYGLRAELDQIMAGGPPTGCARQEIVNSWRRSIALGLRPDRFAVAAPYTVDGDSPFVATARPVVDRLGGDLALTEISVVPTDDQGRIALRRAPSQLEEHRLDNVMLAPGYNWAFEHAGTNGLSDALATGTASLANGGEHFFDSLSTITTAGAPIRDPRTARLIGVLGLVCSTATPNSLLLPMARRAARDVEGRPQRDRSAPDRAVKPGSSSGRPVSMPRPPFGWEALTPAELSVIELVAEGLTNREIGSKLYLSRYTIDAHLRHIFQKLEVRSRVDLVRIATVRVLTTAESVEPAAVA
jgi:DNA-binding CsgD family transcriptional regulator